MTTQGKMEELEIVERSEADGTWYVRKNGGLNIAIFFLQSDARSFIAGEKAIEACKQIASMWTPKMDEAIKRHEHSGTEAFDDQEWTEAAAIQGICRIALSALPAEETKWPPPTR